MIGEGKSLGPDSNGERDNKEVAVPVKNTVFVGIGVCVELTIQLPQPCVACEDTLKPSLDSDRDERDAEEVGVVIGVPAFVGLKVWLKSLIPLPQFSVACNKEADMTLGASTYMERGTGGAGIVVRVAQVV